MKELDRTKLKIIAITAMVIDHMAWGFLPFWTPLAQILHLIGRMTLPIMCFFIAEGFRHTSDLKRYVERMATFFVVSIIPFYLFFREEYGYRQNIIFDQLLGLLVLVVLESQKLKKWQKVLLTAAIFMVSIAVGGWVILPILYILVFYYGREFQRQAKWFCITTVCFVAFLMLLTWINQHFQISSYEWKWYEEFYFLGFMLPLLLLGRYNGKKGKNIGKYFFYFFYPLHFMVLWGIQLLKGDYSIFAVYVGIHILALVSGLVITIVVILAKPSRGQTATLVMALSGCTYMLGFVMEITSTEVSGFYSATIMEYFGECVLFIGFTFFVAEMCHQKINNCVYAMEAVFSVFIMWMLFTTGKNGFFYTSISVDRSGPFPRAVFDRNWGFFLWAAYMLLICVCSFFVCLIRGIQSKGVERKRLLCTAFSITCPWFPMLIREMGLTSGYEIPAIGIVGTMILVTLALLRYGFFDSVALASENALKHGREGIVVIDVNHVVTYYNERAKQIFGSLALKKPIAGDECLNRIFEGKRKTLEENGRIYEMRVENLYEGGYEQGHMLWILDSTEHYQILERLNELAIHDSLTGIYNRQQFVQLAGDYLKEHGGVGALYMMDMDNFKLVNDKYGHLAGDEVLRRFGQVLLELKEDVLFCRIGGDEFCLFYKGMHQREELEALAKKLRLEFAKKLVGEEYEGKTTLSIGIARAQEGESLEKLYGRADGALYTVKNKSKNTFYLSEEG